MIYEQIYLLNSFTLHHNIVMHSSIGGCSSTLFPCFEFIGLGVLEYQHKILSLIKQILYKKGPLLEEGFFLLLSKLSLELYRCFLFNLVENYPLTLLLPWRTQFPFDKLMNALSCNSHNYVRHSHCQLSLLKTLYILDQFLYLFQSKNKLFLSPSLFNIQCRGAGAAGHRHMAGEKSVRGTQGAGVCLPQ